jgi:hypothetical protein
MTRRLLKMLMFAWDSLSINLYHMGREDLNLCSVVYWQVFHFGLCSRVVQK